MQVWICLARPQPRIDYLNSRCRCLVLLPSSSFSPSSTTTHTTHLDQQVRVTLHRRYHSPLAHWCLSFLAPRFLDLAMCGIFGYVNFLKDKVSHPSRLIHGGILAPCAICAISVSRHSRGPVLPYMVVMISLRYLIATSPGPQGTP
jgi:hypothetical protein